MMYIGLFLAIDWLFLNILKQLVLMMVMKSSWPLQMLLQTQVL